jgi:hypothetical protein
MFQHRRLSIPVLTPSYAYQLAGDRKAWDNQPHEVVVKKRQTDLSTAHRISEGI